MAAARAGISVLIALCGALALSGCANGNFELDPAYWFPDGKTKLAGDRREVFPGGVPGVSQGVPAELVRGSPQQQAEQQQALAPVQEAKPEVQEKPKPRPKKVVARPRPAPAPEAEPQPQPAQRAAPPSSGWGPPPQQQPQQPQAQQQQPPPASAWPAPPGSGTFAR